MVEEKTDIIKNISNSGDGIIFWETLNQHSTHKKHLFAMIKITGNQIY